MLTTCRHCHHANEHDRETCAVCGHDAQKPRAACTCEQCALPVLDLEDLEPLCPECKDEGYLPDPEAPGGSSRCPWCATDDELLRWSQGPGPKPWEPKDRLRPR